MNFVRMHDAAVLPVKAFEDDAGFDLALPEDEWFEPGRTQLVPLGVGLRLEEGQYGLLTGRSSTLMRYGLMVYPGIIDRGYHGELKIVVHNVAGYEIDVRAGERLAQLIPMRNVGFRTEPGWVNPNLEAGSERGTGGFGSSG